LPDLTDAYPITFAAFPLCIAVFGLGVDIKPDLAARDFWPEKTGHMSARFSPPFAPLRRAFRAGRPRPECVNDIETPGVISLASKRG
jgi:hypothetical protein